MYSYNYSYISLYMVYGVFMNPFGMELSVV